MGEGDVRHPAQHPDRSGGKYLDSGLGEFPNLQVHSEGRKANGDSVGGQPAKGSNFKGTTDIAFGPGGRLFIADGYGNARILEYMPDGKRVREWGSPGTCPCQFHLPHGIAIDSDGVIYVADRENGRVQRFDLDGNYKSEWNHLGKVFAVTVHEGKLWVGTQQRNEPNGAPGWLMEVDRRAGAIRGYVDSAGRPAYDKPHC